jgi:hypothetical protein
LIEIAGLTSGGEAGSITCGVVSIEWPLLNRVPGGNIAIGSPGRFK